MPDNVDNETLLIKVKAEDEASDVLKRIKDNLDKLPNDTEKLKYLTSQISSFARQARKASPATKTLIKDINKVLGVGKGFKVKSLPNTLKNLSSLKSNIVEDYRTQLPKPKINENMQGRVFYEDTTKGIAKTEEINEIGERIVRTYHDVSNASGQWQGVLKSETITSKNNNKNLTKSEKILKNLKIAGKGVGKALGSVFGRLSRIFTSIIAFRLASSFITLFINAFKKGFEAIKKSSDNLVQNFEEFNVATTQISISLATSFIPLIQSLATILTPLSEKLLNVANYMSATNAVAKGQSEYFELDAQKIREYSKSLEEANKQLTQLDKFATLTSKSNYSLGNWKDIQDFDFENVDEGTKELAKSFEDISNLIMGVVKALNTLGVDGTATIVLLITALGGIFNPISAIISGIGAMILLFSSSNPLIKEFAKGLMILSGAFIGLGVAKAFAQDWKKGLVVGAIAGGVVASILSMVNNLANGRMAGQGYKYFPISSSSSSNSGGQSLMEGITSANNNGSNAYQIQSGDVYLDTTKVGRVLAPQINVSSQKRNY